MSPLKQEADSSSLHIFVLCQPLTHWMMLLRIGQENLSQATDSMFYQLSGHHFGPVKLEYKVIQHICYSISEKLVVNKKSSWGPAWPIPFDYKRPHPPPLSTLLLGFFPQHLALSNKLYHFILINCFSYTSYLCPPLQSKAQWEEGFFFLSRRDLKFGWTSCKHLLSERTDKWKRSKKPKKEVKGRVYSRC